MKLCDVRHWFSTSNAVGNKVACYSEKISPLGYRHRATTKSNFSHDASIVHLLFSSRPSDIFWRIIAVVISTIKFFTNWFFTNVFQKIYKRFRPTLAHFYAACPVIFVSPVVWIFTPTLYRRPHFVHFGLGLTVRFSCAQTFDIETPTTTCESSSKRLRVYKLATATFAHTFPMNFSTNNNVLVGDKKSSKFLPRNVVEACHG